MATRRGTWLALVVLGAVLLAPAAGAAGDAGGDTTNSDIGPASNGVVPHNAATGNGGNDSDTVVQGNSNNSTKTETNYTNNILNKDTDNKDVIHELTVSDNENDALSVRSVKYEDGTNTRISNESTNENSRISKTSSTLMEVSSNKLATDVDAGVDDSKAASVDEDTAAAEDSAAAAGAVDVGADDTRSVDTAAVEDTAAVGACPATCSCSGGVVRGAQCTLRGGAVIIVTREGDHYTVECRSSGAALQVFMDEDGEDNATDIYRPIHSTPHVSYADLPSLSQWLGASGTAGAAVTVRECDVRVRYMAAALGVTLSALMVQDAGEWRLTHDDVTGMQELQELGIYYHESPSVTLPWEALSTLPRLRTLTVAGASLPLPPTLPPLTVTRLELSNGRLSVLGDGVFRRLHMLERLYLHNNHLTDVSGGVFQGLSNLLELGLSSNQLSSVPVRALAEHCPRLTVLSAFDNAITAVPPIRHLNQLTELELFYNRVPLSLPAGCLAHAPALRVVDLRDSGVTSLPRDVIANSTRLRTLLLQGNHITTLPTGLFTQQQELETLDLSNNMLTELHRDVFSGLTALTELRLDNNNITHLPDGVTLGLRSLRTLSARHSNITAIGSGALTGCPDLVELLLDHNRLTTRWLDMDMAMDQMGLALNGLRQLQVIDLSHNNLTAAPADVTSLLSLKRLDLSSNLISRVDDLNYLSQAVTVDLSHNLIQSLDLLPADTTDGDTFNSTVLLEDNPFVCNCLFYNAVRRVRGYRHPHVDRVQLVFGGATCSLPAPLAGRPVAALREEDVYCDVTREEYCSGGGDTCLPDDCTIAYRPHTRTLDVHCQHMPPTLPDVAGWPVAGIRLTLHTPPPSWGNLTGVTMLNVSGAGVRAVPGGTPPTSVRVIDLSHNNITDIPVLLLQNNITLHLSGNPLRCDCWSSSSVSLMQQRRHLVADYNTATCASGGDGGGSTPVRRVSAGQLCSARTAAAVGGALAAVGLLAAALALVLLRYRVEAEILLGKLGVLRRRDESTDGMTYDAFVSYAHEDDAFVTQHLLPRLEGGAGLRLCVHSRDWVPGEWIASSIAASVANSRRTLILLSQHFLRSRWGRLELQAATGVGAAGGGGGRTRLVVVLLEDVAHHPDLDPELRAHLRTNTYLRWGDPWFWSKLLHALPPPRRPHPRPAASQCDVITPPRDLMQRVADGEHPADVIMAANAGQQQTHDKDNLKQNQTLNATNDNKNNKYNDNMTLEPKLGAFNDKLKHNLHNQLTAAESALDALEQLHGKRNIKVFQ